MENEQEIKFYSVAEVSEILGISRSKAYEWVVSSYCPFLVMRIGRRVIIPANNFNACLNASAPIFIVRRHRRSSVGDIIFNVIYKL